MSTEPILLVIGIAIAVNLVIMGGLLVTLIARRRSRFAPAEGFLEPPPYRYAMDASPPSATSPISFIDDGLDEYERTDEDLEEDVSATEPVDYRRYRPVMTETGEEVGPTVASFPTTGPVTAVPPGRPTAEAPRPGEPAGPVPGPSPLGASRSVAATAERVPRPEEEGALDWEMRVRDEESRLARYRRPVSVVLVELDGLARLIERLGPDAAERIVPPVGQTLVRQARAADHVARVGRSRFAVLMPETDEIQAINYVERVRAECDRWLAAGAVSMRLAIGWACPTPGGDIRTATRLAEARLHRDRRRAFPRADEELEPAPRVAYRPTTVEPGPGGLPGVGGLPIEGGVPGEVELTPPEGAG